MEITQWLFALIIAVNIAALGLGLVWMFTAVRRNLQMIKSEGDGSKQDQILDAMERIEVRLSVMSDRMAELEEGQAMRLESGDEDGPDRETPT